MRIRFADVFTFLSLAAGMLAAALSIRQDLQWAGVFLLLSVLLDWLDGKIARHFNQASTFGSALDALVDISVFGVVPVIIAFMAVGVSPLLFAAGFLYVAAGVYRLARFQVAKTKDFQGMPITMNGIFVAIILFFSTQMLIVFSLYFVVSAILMVSTFRVKKLG